MAFKKKVFIRELKKRRDAMIIGGIIGAGAAYWALSQGFDLNTIVASGKGLLDTVLSRSAPLTLASYKLYGAFITFGVVVGFISDMILERLGLIKWR